MRSWIHPADQDEVKGTLLATSWHANAMRPLLGESF
jgi:hypothetical protein